MIKRNVRRALSVVPAVLVTAFAATLLAAAPASASTVGERKGAEMTFTEILLVFVGIPLLIFVVCAAFVWATESRRDPRLREGQGWWSQPEYFTGQAGQESDAATASAGSADGGDAATGGASARW